MITSQEEQQLIESYPMGPNLRRFLGLSTKDTSAQDSDKEHKTRFVSFLEKYVPQTPLTSTSEFSAICEELVMMNISEIGLLLKTSNPEIQLDDDFKSLLTYGSAAMATGDTATAEASFTSAQKLEPLELAPYINMTRILSTFPERRDEFLQWATTALDVDLNSPEIWDSILIMYDTTNPDSSGEQLLKIAKEKNSWMGCLLAGQLLAPEDPMFRAELLEDLYKKGVDDPIFLTEFTASLGVAMQYQKIPPIIWRAEKVTTATFTKLPWQLYVHGAQAYLGLENQPQADHMLKKALSDRNIPVEARTQLELLQKEIDA